MIRGIAVVAVSAMVLGGCASSTDRQMQYDSYTAALIKLAELQANAKPVVDTKFTDSGGKEVHLVVNLPVQMQQVQQIKNDEELAFWGQVINGGLGVVGNVGTAFMSGYFSYKNNEAMWDALSVGGFGGNRIDTGGGDFNATESLNSLDMTASGNSSIVSEAFTEKNPIVSGEGTSASVGGITATPTNTDDDTTTTTTTTTNTATDSPTTNNEEGLF